MQQYGIGDILKAYRERLGLTQEDLCDQDISPVTISRIESGENIPTNEVVNIIFSRMGMPLPYNIMPVTDEEYQHYLLSEKIKTLAEKEDFSYEEDLERYKNEAPYKDPFTRQFYYYHKGLLLTAQGKNKEALDAFTAALRETVPEFKVKDKFPVKKYITSFEFRILTRIAFLISDYDEENAFRWYLFIFDSLNDPRFDNKQRNLLFFETLFNGARALEENGTPKRVLEFCDQGLEYCRMGPYFFEFPKILRTKAHAYRFMGEEKKASFLENAAQSFDEALEEAKHYKKTARQEKAS